MAGRSPVCYASSSKRWGNTVLEAFAEGAGGSVVMDSPRLVPGAVSVFWGVSPETYALFHRARDQGLPYVYLDHGYLGPRKGRVRVTANRLQHDGRGVADPRRFEALGVAVAPWRRAVGDYVLITPPGDLYCALTRQGFTAAEWLRRVDERVRAATSLPIKIRRKPAIIGAGESLAYELGRAWCLVTHQSVTGLEAAFAGVPVFTTAPEAPAARVGLTDLGEIQRPRRSGDRHRLGAVLAANQFTLDELADGTAWQQVSADLGL